MGFSGQMEQYISSGKNGSKFVKNDPVELGRLGRVVPRKLPVLRNGGE